MSVIVWTVGDVLGLIVVVVLLVIWAAAAAKRWWRQAWCKHADGVRETSSCDAICRTCGKNLGFVGDWRKSQR